VQFITVTVSNPATPVVTATHTITIANPLPTLTAIQPTTATINGLGFNLILTGTGFVANSQALWDGGPLATTFVTSRTLQAVISNTLLTVIGPHPVAVFNPLPGGGATSNLTFTVTYPAPHITTTAPTGVAAGSPSFTLIITGSNFVAGATLHWSGQANLTTSGSGSTLTAIVPAGYLQLAAGVSLSVTNPTPNNGPSNVVAFSLTNPTITLTPATATILVSTNRVFTVTLSAIQAADRVISVTSSLPLVASVPPTITLPAGLTSTTFTATGQPIAGVVAITATLPASLGGGSDSSVLTVNYPTPVLNTIGPVSATAGGLTFTLNLTGSNFVSGASLNWAGQPALPTTGSGSALQATVPFSYLATTGVVAITVTNPSPSAGPSGSQSFTIVPLLLTLAPDPIIAGRGETAIVTLTVSALQAGATPITLTFAPVKLLVLSTPVTLPAQTLQTTIIVTGGKGSTGVLTGTLPVNLGGDSDSILVTVRNPVPHITTTSPLTGVVGDPNFTLVITGYNFVSDSELWFDGNLLTDTGFISDTQLTATVPSAYFPFTDNYGLLVVNSAPGGGTSNTFFITVVNPLPTATDMSPTAAIAGGSGFTLVVTGTGFINGGSTVRWNGADRATTWISSTKLQATILTSDLVNPGPANVTVFNTGPGGGTSSPALVFTIATSQPVITSLNPNTHSVISPTFTLTVTGSNFVNPSGLPRDSVILWYDGSITTTLTTTIVSSSTLTGNVPTGLFTTAGVYSVTVLNPDPSPPGDKLSNRLPFTVTNPLPAISALNPTFTVSGGVSFTLRVTGTNFINGASSIYLTGTQLADSTWISSTVLTATVPSSFLVNPAFLGVAVQTTGPGGGTSNTLFFGVDNQPATLLTITPITGTVFSPLNIGVFGSNIAPGTQLRWNTTTLSATIVISPSELAANVPQSLYPVGGVYSITMISPAPPAGGVLSTNALTLTVFNPLPNPRFLAPAYAVAGMNGYTLTITTDQPSYLPGLQVRLAGQVRTTQYISSTMIQVGLLTSDFDTAATLVLSATNPLPNLGSTDFIYSVDPLVIQLTPASAGPLTLPNTPTLTITIGAIQAADRVITLTSSLPLVASVPATVTVPAGLNVITTSVTGQTSGTVTITGTLPTALGGLTDSSVFTFNDATITGLNAVDNSPTLLGAGTRFTATITGGTNVSYRWNFGDGSPATAFTTTNTAIYTYTTAGFYTAIVTATNTVDTDTDTDGVEIDNPDPAISGMAPLTATQAVTTTFAITGSNFISGASVLVRLGAGVTTTISGASVMFVDGSHLTVLVPASAISVAGSYSFFVVNPSPPVAEDPRRSNGFIITFT